MRKAFEQEKNIRKQLQDKAQHIEQENRYLNTQIKMEHNVKAELQQKNSTLKSQFSEINQKLLQKEAELQKRTEELIHARSSQEEAIEEEIQQIRDVERVTNKARTKQNKFLSILSKILFSSVQSRAVRTNFGSWKSTVQSISKRLTFLKLVSKFCFFHNVGKSFLLWSKHVDVLNSLRKELDRFLNIQCKSCVRRVFHLWYRAALENRKKFYVSKVQELEACCLRLSSREKELVEQVDSTLELLEAADNKNSRKQEELRAVIMQLRVETQALEARFAQAQTERIHLEQRLVDSDKNVALLAEARSQSLKAEANAEKLADELRIVRDERQQGLVVEQQLESSLATLQSHIAAQDRRAEELEDRIVASKVDLARFATQEEARCSQLAAMESALTAEKEARAMIQQVGKQRDEELIVARRQVQELAALQEMLDDEKARRRAVEDALGKLVAAFKEQKLSLRHRQQGTALRLLISKFFFGWFRTSSKAYQERAADRVRAVEHECETQRIALDEEGAALRSCMQQLTAMRLAAEAAAAREVTLESACDKAESQLAELKARYLEGVKSSVQTIRLCRDRYLAASPVGAADARGGAGGGGGADHLEEL